MVTITIQPKAIATTEWAQAMTIIKRGWSTYLIGQNKYIRLWYQRLVNISNVRIVRVVKLVNNINLKQYNREYNFMEVFIDLDNSDTSDCSDHGKLAI